MPARFGWSIASPFYFLSSSSWPPNAWFAFTEHITYTSPSLSNVYFLPSLTTNCYTRLKRRPFFFLFSSLYLFSLSSYFILTHTRSLSVTRQPHSFASLFPFPLFSHHLPVSSCFLSPLSLILLVSCCRIFLLFSPSGKEKTRKKSSLSTPPFSRQRAKSRFY